MNIYLLVEGDVGEKNLYEKWINYINPNLIYVDHISKINHNNYSIFSGGGHPQYLMAIEAAIEDVNNFTMVNRLVIAVDSEDLTYDEKIDEIESHISNYQCNAEIIIIIQHYCLETWALGNRSIISRFPQSERLRKFIDFYNVRIDDPALLEPYDGTMTRAQFSEVYLRCALNEKYKNLTYKKSNPKTILHPTYFQKVKERYEDTGHIQSFSKFLTAFI